MEQDKTPGLNFLGTIDDMVVRYPWKFKLTRSKLDAALVTQLIDGRPIVLNDGYLVNHPLARAALLDRKSLLWELMRIGYVRVLARGGRQYTLDEMPVRMAPTIKSFQDLVDDKVDGVKWSALKAALAKTDQHLRKQGHLLEWPPYDAGSGFRVLAERLRDRHSTAHSLGIGHSVGTPVFKDFLAEFIARMESDTRGARDFWEGLARKFSMFIGNESKRKEFVHALMRLGNEMYHYNMGIMLAAHHDVRVSVETQTSAAFDDLLVSQNVYLDELNRYPKLNVPQVITTVHPTVLASILDPDREVFKARREWMEQRGHWEDAHGALYENDASQVSDVVSRNANDAGRRYARELSRMLGEQVKYDKGEGLFSYAVGAAFKASTAKVAVGGAALAATYMSGPVAGVATFVAGFMVATGQKKMLSSVTKKFKVVLLDKQIVPPEVVQRSARTIERIKARKVPSAIDIDPRSAELLAARMARFESSSNP